MEIFQQTSSLIKIDEHILTIKSTELKLIQEGLEVVVDACRQTEKNAHERDVQLCAREQADLADMMIIKIKEALDGGKNRV